MSAASFMKGIGDDLLNQAMDGYVEELHGKASSVVDPKTGKHAHVFVRRIGNDGFTIHTSGSPAFARALEQRLGLNRGEVHGMQEPANRKRLVYLAHASEDKDVALPLAKGLMERGIDTWYDNWEIGSGDSLRRKMEQGLGECTHFVVLLSEKSLEKPWVQEEIDAGLMSAVEGSAKFIGLRHGLPLERLSPFLRTRLSPDFTLNEESLETLAGDIYGVSRKPPLGEKPRYVQSHEEGSTWSVGARIVAEYFCRTSVAGRPWDPQVTFQVIHQETGLPMSDVRVGVLDLVGAGLMERSDTTGGSRLSPKAELFATFDGDFMDWAPEKDAKDLAVFILNRGDTSARSSELGDALGWPARRFNPAAAYLVGAKAVKPYSTIDRGGYHPTGFRVGDELLRFVKSL